MKIDPREAIWWAALVFVMFALLGTM